MPVRGAGYPEGAFAMERLLDRIADELQLDRAEVRRRNLVPPEKMPYVFSAQETRARRAPITLDSGRFPRATSAPPSTRSTMPAFAERQRPKSSERPLSLGIGVGNGAQGDGPAGPFESGIVRIGRSGRVSVYTGAMPMGQGIKTAPLPKFCAEQFGIAPDTVSVIAGGHRGHSLWPGRLSPSRQKPSPRVSAVHLAARKGARTRRSKLPPTCWR